MSEISKELLSLDDIQADIRRTLMGKCDIITLSANFRALRSNSERVYFAYDILKEYNLLPDVVQVTKCDEKAEERRTFGNHKFSVLKDDYAAMKHYNKSIAYAESKKVLALAFANRSAIFFQNNLYEECLKDISYAFLNDYPENLHEKLNKRKENAEICIMESKSKIMKEYFTEIPNITIKNNYFQCASNQIEMKHSDTLGRHIIATEDIKPGEIIAVEKPFAKILLYEFYLTHCNYCLRTAHNLVACLQCPLTLYCSETCREAAWNQFHQYECSILDTLHLIKATKIQLLALRVVLCARNEFASVLNEQIPSSKDLSIYRSESYAEIHNLVTNQECRLVKDLFGRSLVAAILLHLLESTSFFYGDLDVYNMRKCTATLLLHHLQTAPSNMHEISELHGVPGNDYENVEIGAGAYAFLSLLNHSCSPNVVRHCHGTTLVLRSLCSILKGQQLFDNYGYHHALMPRDERQKHLKDQYCFTCQCEACTNNWPLYQELPLPAVELELTLTKFDALVKADRQVAKELIPELIENAQGFEHCFKDICAKVLDNQEVLKQCYSILGNKHSTF